ncbi:MAG TPA: hypothetical protein VFE33_00330 [Thermoanaerobaculia bacterium]|nr:hypothetical protein [Thermoanaerobaculia bacterium]
MRSQIDSTPSHSHASNAFNAFSTEFLRRLDEMDEPPSAAEADVAGPWKIEICPDGGYALLRQGESLARGDRPAGTFERRETAFLAAAILPSRGRDPLYRLRGEETPRGFALEGARGETAGHLEYYDPDAAAALHVAESLLRSPEALARLLEAAGRVALLRAGKIVFERVE